jgi:hypothetical protein
MDTHLRPMSLGEILDRTAQLYRSNFLLFAGIAAVYAGSLMVFGLAHIGLQALFQSLHWTKQLIWLTGSTIVVQFVVQFVLGGLAVAANNRAVAWVHLGQRATIRGAYVGVLPRLGSFMWLMTIITFVLWTPLGIGYGGLAALMYWYMPHAKNGAHVDQGTIVLFGLLFLLVAAVLFAALIYGLLMGLRYALAVPAWIVEETTARAALRRSIDLSQGSRGRIFLLGLLVAAIEVALLAITQSFFIFFAFKNHGELPTWASVLQQIVAFATNSFILPIYATGITLFYYDLRVRKEGFDIEWMMQAAGLNASLDAAAAPSELSASSATVEGAEDTLQAEANEAGQLARGEQP